MVIRATPQVGKTTLLLLLGYHIRTKETDLEPVYFSWKEKDRRESIPFHHYLKEKEKEWKGENARHRQPNSSARTIT